MNINDAFPSKWLKALDFEQTGPRQMFMSQVITEEMGQGVDKQNKPVLYFQGETKGMVLNKTTSGVIADHYGQQTEAWTGHPIWLFSTDVESFGKMTKGIRCSINQPQMMTPGPQTQQYQEYQQQQPTSGGPPPGPPQQQRDAGPPPHNPQPAPLNNPPGHGGAEYQAPFVDPNAPKEDVPY